MTLQAVTHEAEVSTFSDLEFNRDGTITYLSPSHHVVLRTHCPPERDLMLMPVSLRESVVSHLTATPRRRKLVLSEVDE